MKARLSARDRKQFEADFTTILTISLIANAKGLDKKDRQSIKECMARKQIHQALKIIERKYSARGWKTFVEEQAQPLLRGYSKDVVRV